jgi:hypothetical protein
VSIAKERLFEKSGVEASVVGVAAALVYLTSLKIPFLTWDDTYYVTNSFRTQSAGLNGFFNLWSSDDIWSGRFLEFFPLRDTVYWVIWQLFGRNPVPFHVVNILLHAAASVLALELARRLGFSRSVAFWGALLFAVHPVHVESVGWIAALKDPLFMSFMLGSLLFYVRYRELSRPVDYALSLLCLVASLLVKGMAICTPLLIIAVERFSEQKTPWRLVLLRGVGPALIVALFTVQFVMVGRAANVITPPHGGGWPNHAFLSGWAFVRYLRQAFVPASFSLHYCFAPMSGWADLRLVLIVAALVGVAVLFLVSRRRAPRVALLIVWFLACLAPVANIVPYPALMADRYLYAASFGSCLLISWALNWTSGLIRPVLLTCLVLAFGGLTLHRGAVWQVEANLWNEVVKNDACLADDSPTTAVAYLKFAGFQRDPDLALGAYNIAINHVGFRSLFRADQCFHLSAASQVALAANQLNLARRYANEAVSFCPYLAGSWVSLMLSTARNEPQLALEAARRAYRLMPVPTNQWHRGQARLKVGDADGVEDIAAAVERAPNLFCRSFANWLRQASSNQGERVENARRMCGMAPIAAMP